MSHIPFLDQNVAAATASNLGVYRRQIIIPAVSGTARQAVANVTNDPGRNSFTPMDVWFHVDDNSGVDTLTFTCSIGSNVTWDNVCPSTIRGSAGTAALQLRQNKAIRFPIRTDTSQYLSSGLMSETIFLNVTAFPASQITATVFVVGYFTGVRP